MVSLSDIPFVGAAFDKISEATVEAVICGLRYMLCYKRLMNDLNFEIGKINIQEERVTEKIVEAKDDGKIIKDHVVAWKEKVVDVRTQADELTRQTSSTTCFKVVHLPNPVSRFRLGRRAAHLAKTVTQHTDSGKELLANEIAHYAPDENVPISDTTYQSFGSRQEAYEKLWNALVNTNGYPIIGICGMAGVGKTRMMEKAWEELKDKKIFDKVTRVNVGGEKLDVIKLQDQLSGHLNCHLEPSNNEVKRASQLKGSLKNGGKVLVILDDVWDLIPLQQIGIPFGDGSSKGCKILLTSRKDTVCHRNNCRDPIRIETLRDEEAWEMFRNIVGSSKINSLNDSSLAKKVCKECGALPLLIGAVGSALKDSTENFWKDALYQLENCKFQEIDGIDPRVYNGLKFSFEKLAKGEKACLLLCSFFPEDADIDIKRLFEMATGSQLLDSGRNIGGLVDSLKSSSLLIEGTNDDYVKVHDIIRDVARSIAIRDPGYAFLSVSCRSRLPDNEEYPYPTRRLLHLNLEGESVGFPDDLVCQDLHTLWMQSYGHSQQLSSGFFNAFVNIKVLLLRGKFLFDDQLTIPNLEKLRVLILERCKISQTFISSVSKNLEILRIQRCHQLSLVDLPELKNLRKLEILDDGEIEIVEKAISRLSSLEELIVPCGFKSRDGDDDKSICWELSQLGCLRNLAITLRKLWQFPDRDIFSNLVEFSIQAGRRRPGWFVNGKFVRFEGIHIEGWWMPLVERAEVVQLSKVTGLPTNGLSETNIGEAFAKLKRLSIWRCDEMEHVARWEKGRNQRLKCFTNLTSLDITYCSRLKYVFSCSVAKCLLQLQTLEIIGCYSIEEIIRVEESTDDDDDDDQQEIICFPNLQTLILDSLPSLKRFCRKKVTFHNITRLDIQNVDNTKSLLGEIEMGSNHGPYSKLERLFLSSIQPELLPSQMKLQLQNLEELVLNKCWWPGNSLFNGSLTFNTLNELEVYNIPEISTLFTTSVFTSLHQLETLKVKDCSLLKGIVEWEEDARNDDDTNDHNTPPISLLQLQYLTLSNLPNLQNNIGIRGCYMPALVEVKVKRCGLITSLFTRSAFRNLQHLKKLKVSDCSLLEEIVEDEMDDSTPGVSEISLPLLTSITLKRLPRLRSFSSSATYTFNMPALYSITLHECPYIKRFTSLRITTPSDVKINDDNIQEMTD